MNYNKRGEIATLLVLGLVLTGAVITLATSLFISNQKTKLASNLKAQTQCSWGDWDCAAAGANNEAGRICANMGKSFCAPGDGRQEPGNPNNVCVPNKWDTTWGCWGNPSLPNVPGVPDSPPVPGNACGLTRSQYGSCPDSATENSCYQRLDPPGDPDYGKWFKCVNRWWNGPCDSKEACDGVAKPPVDTSIKVPAVPPVGTAITPAPGKPPGTLGGVCLTVQGNPTPYCYSGFTCENNICVIYIPPANAVTCNKISCASTDANPSSSYYYRIRDRTFFETVASCKDSTDRGSFNQSLIKETVCSSNKKPPESECIVATCRDAGYDSDAKYSYYDKRADEFYLNETCASTAVDGVRAIAYCQPSPTVQVKGNTIYIVNGKLYPIDEVRIFYTIFKPILILGSIGPGEVRELHDHKCGVIDIINNHTFSLTIFFKDQGVKYSLKFNGNCDYNNIFTIN